jgi:hypothetical protein
MGLFTSVISKATSAVKATGAAIATGLDTLQAAYANPTTFVTQGPSAAIAKTQQSTPTQNAIKVGTNALIAGGVILGASSTIGKTVLTAAAKTLIPKTATQTLITAAAVPIVVGAFTSQPKESAKVILEAGPNLANLGGNLADFAADPSLEKAKDIITENPITSGLIAGGAALSGGLLAIGPIVTALNTDALRDNTKATEDRLIGIPKENEKNYSIGPSKAVETFSGQSSTIDTTPAGVAPTPITPQTQQISATSKKKKKRSKVSKPQNISQRVNVIVSNKNYIKRSVY